MQFEGEKKCCHSDQVKLEVCGAKGAPGFLIVLGPEEQKCALMKALKMMMELVLTLMLGTC